MLYELARSFAVPAHQLFEWNDAGVSVDAESNRARRECHDVINIRNLRPKLEAMAKAFNAVSGN